MTNFCISCNDVLFNILKVSMSGCDIEKIMDKISFLLISQKLFIVRKLTFRSKVKFTKFPAV